MRGDKTDRQTDRTGRRIRQTGRGRGQDGSVALLSSHRPLRPCSQESRTGRAVPANVVVVVVVAVVFVELVAFYSRGFWENVGPFIPSLRSCFKVKITLFMPGSVHRGSAS